MEYKRHEIIKGVFLISQNDGNDVRYGLATENGFQLKPVEYAKIVDGVILNGKEYLMLYKGNDYSELMQVKTLLKLLDETVEIGENPTLKRRLYK